MNRKVDKICANKLKKILISKRTTKKKTVDCTVTILSVKIALENSYL